MLITEKNEFAILMMSIAELYSKKLSLPLLEIYWRALERFSFIDVREAFDKHAVNPDNGQFMPKPADVIRYIEGTTEIRSLQAWSKLTLAIKLVGAYLSIVFDDSLLHLVINDSGGWIHLCHSTEKQLSYYEHQFCKRYAAYVIYAPTSYPKKLIGIVEHQNSFADCHVPLPILFGDKERAKAVYHNGCEQELITYKHELLLIEEKPQPPLAIEQIHFNNYTTNEG